MPSKRIIIMGAGPTGLGAAYRLKELGYENWVIYEKEDYIGGLSSNFKDKKVLYGVFCNRKLTHSGDRLTHHCEIVETGCESYRLKSRK